MNEKNLCPRSPQAVAILCAVALSVLAACGSSSPVAQDLGVGQVQEKPSSSDSSESLTQDDQELDSDTNADATADADPISEIDVGAGSTRQEVFDTFNASEQSCIKDRLGEDIFELVMKQTAISEDAREQWVAAIFSCSDFDTPRRQFLGGLMADIREGLGGEVEVSEDEWECLREWVIGLDEDDITVMLTQEDASAAALHLGAVACVPDQIVELVAIGMGVTASDLSDDERECLREWVGSLDEDDMTVIPTQEYDAAFAALGLGLIGSCVPDLFVEGMTVGMGVTASDRSNDEQECVRERVADVDPATLTAEDDAILGIAIFVVIACVPDLLFKGIADRRGVTARDLSDDERECLREWVDGLDKDDMTVMLAQEDDAVAAALGLTFIACVPNLLTQGMADAAPPTAECNTIADAGNRQDDHANTIEDATPLAVREAAEGAIDHDVDFDFFVFAAKAGQSYQIDVAPGTMRDPVVSLCDGEELLAYNDDYDGLAPRIYWEAPSWGPYYVKVEGWGTGTYTLTVTAESPL